MSESAPEPVQPSPELLRELAEANATAPDTAPQPPNSSELLTVTVADVQEDPA